MKSVVVASIFAATGAAAIEPDQLADLSLEELGMIQVTSVSKVRESLIDAAASVFVITHDEIVRSGYTSIPELLRLAPGVEVARRSANAWSISIRGYNDNLANKLLVLIDGRSVYSPLYAGVFWDVQDTVVEDIERIEVIEGPGGALWGANAVNGVINVITRSANDTVGTYLDVGGGNEDQGFGSLRYGTTVGDNLAVRGYAKYFDRDSSGAVGGGQATDGWHMARAGARAGWAPTDADTMRWDTSIYRGSETYSYLDDFTFGTLPQALLVGNAEVSGGHLMGDWRRVLGDDRDLRVKVYYDHTSRDLPNTYKEVRDTVDLDVQHSFTLGDRQQVLWGAGYRLTRDDIGNTIFATFEPASRTDRTANLFVQDRIGLFAGKATLTVGSKFEHNDYTGFEWQPSLRLSWQPNDRQTVWAAVSRAVRIPSRLDSDLRLTVPVALPNVPFPVYGTVNGSEDFDSEILTASEAGFRWQGSEQFNVDISLFYHDYDQLQTREPRDPIVVFPSYAILPNVLENKMHGQSRGGVMTVNWQPLEFWRLRFNYAYLDMQLALAPDSEDPGATAVSGSSPRNQVSLFSFVDLFDTVNAFVAVRHIDALPSQNIEAYTSVDLNIGWNVSDNLRLSLAGFGIGKPRHSEFGPADVELERSWYARATLSF